MGVSDTVYSTGEARIMADLNDFYPSAQPNQTTVATGGRPQAGAPATTSATLGANVSGSVGAPAAWVLGIVAFSLLLLHLGE